MNALFWNLLLQFGFTCIIYYSFYMHCILLLVMVHLRFSIPPACSIQNCLFVIMLEKLIDLCSSRARNEINVFHLGLMPPFSSQLSLLPMTCHLLEFRVEARNSNVSAGLVSQLLMTNLETTFLWAWFHVLVGILNIFSYLKRWQRKVTKRNI